jgi:hypothetical protein
MPCGTAEAGPSFSTVMRATTVGMPCCMLADERTVMIPESKLDDLIEAGWSVLYRDFDRTAFRKWQAQAITCLASLLGPDHSYTLAFKSHVQDAEELSVLIGGGILTAAREEMQKKN